MVQKAKVIVSSIAVAALATAVLAQSEKKSSAKGAAILQPQMTVETGSYEKPHGKLGQKPAQPWSATTMGASVDGKANPAKVATLVGEIVDFSCYLQIRKHGEKHRDCGQKCFEAGQPIGLLTKDGNLYMLMEEEHDPRRDGMTAFRKAAIDHTAHIMEVSGTLSSHAGYQALYVTGFMKK
ncbi:MAG: hypothetical protein WD696_16420 [Bryobacteraceae bacterium]